LGKTIFEKCFFIEKKAGKNAFLKEKKKKEKKTSQLFRNLKKKNFFF